MAVKTRSNRYQTPPPNKFNVGERTSRKRVRFYDAWDKEEQRDAKPDNLQQPWSFTKTEGDVRCIGHAINLAVQAALKTLKSEPAEETETYRMIYNSATLPLEF